MNYVTLDLHITTHTNITSDNGTYSASRNYFDWTFLVQVMVENEAALLASHSD